MCVRAVYFEFLWDGITYTLWFCLSDDTVNLFVSNKCKF